MSDLDELRAEVRRLSDREAIRDVLRTFVAATDAQDWKLLETVWTEDAILDHGHFPSKDGSDDVWRGKDQIMSRIIAGISRHFTSHHLLANDRIVIDGDRARTVTYLQSVHLDDPTKPAEHGGFGGWYFSQLVRTRDGWKISRLSPTPVWFSGEFEPPGPVTKADVERLRAHLS